MFFFFSFFSFCRSVDLAGKWNGFGYKEACERIARLLSSVRYILWKKGDELQENKYNF